MSAGAKFGIRPDHARCGADRRALDFLVAMFVLSISGVIIRTRIFANFFTYRPNGTLLRGSFDLHAVIGGVNLPFLLAIPLSGLVIFSVVYLPAGIEAAYPGKADVFFDEASGAPCLRKAGAPGELGSLDVMRAEAERRWGDGEAALLRVPATIDVGDSKSPTSPTSERTSGFFLPAANRSIAAKSPRRTTAKRPSSGTNVTRSTRVRTISAASAFVSSLCRLSLSAEMRWR